MNVVVNKEEIIQSLAKRMLKKRLTQFSVPWQDLDNYVASCKQEYHRSQHIVINFELVNKYINKSINFYKSQLSQYYKTNIKDLSKWLENHLEKFSHQQLIEIYLQDPQPNFAKNLGLQLCDSPRWVIDHDQIDSNKPLLIRNVVNNQELLHWCAVYNHKFWFVDSGYTNFLLGKKKLWHRLVQNSIHHGPIDREYPADRLDLLPGLPRSWRKKGRTILVIEASENYHRLQGVPLDQWREQILLELSKHTDRPIEFRKKETNKKTRSTVFELLSSSKEYHCVISHSSNAATEAIWAGVPAITLGKHITNSVTQNSLSQVENLYKGDIEPWLRYVSYSQFTFEELCNGEALDIMKRYGHV